MLFFPIQQELDCISDDGRIIGRIRFNADTGKHLFQQDADVDALSEVEQTEVNKRLAGLDAGIYSIPMQDDD